MLDACGAASCMTSGDHNTNCDQHAQVHSQSSHAGYCIELQRQRKTAWATHRFAFARGMRGPMANAEAGSSAQPAAGGQRDADRKR